MIMIFGRSAWLVEYHEDIDYSKAVCKVGDISDLQLMKQNTKLYSLMSKMYVAMRIKDLPLDQRNNPIGLKVRTAKGVIGFYNQGGHCVVFLSNSKENMLVTEAKRDENRLYPQIVEKDEDVLEWEVIDNDSIKCNCQDLTGHRHIINFETSMEI